jgi:hypothetical protein
MEAIVIVIVLLLIFITREIWTWYFKLNKITTQNTEIIRLLRKLANEPEPKTTAEKTGKAIGQLFKK